jgi:dTMP kinase
MSQQSTETPITPTSIPTATNTADGVIVGTDPRPAQTFTPVTTTTSNGVPAIITATTNGPVFTAEQIAKAREDEKAKLYPQLEELKKTVAELQKERDDKLEAETKARKAAEKAAEEARKADTDTRTLLEEQEARFQAQLAALEEERAKERAIAEMETQFQQLQAYKAQALAANADNIIPELASEIQETNHTTAAEVDAHIARLTATSSRIIEQMQAAVQQQRAGMRGAPVTAPPAGPLDTYSGNDPALEAAHNGTLSFEDYVKNRDKLLPAAGRIRNAGLYG